ncbi:hypothetical protein BC827DRAFT_1159510 [Russula dissimulans]|nr:hypothetical protein BC827DRAFT_1159510 [Russula dissimulans]
MSAPPGPPAIPIPPGIAELEVQLNLSFSAAPALFGIIWNWTLYGVLVVQLLYAIFLIETVQTILSGIDGYYRFASGFGSLEHLTDPYLSTFNGPIIGAVVSLTVQYFFAYRVWVLSNKKAFWLCLLICAFSIVDATAAFIGGIYVHVRGRFSSGWKLKVPLYVWLGGNAVSDILITTAMIYYLTIRRSNISVPHSSHALSKIVRLTVETNVLTTTTGIISLLLVSIFPNKIWYTCPTAVLGKLYGHPLYSNTLLVSLNNRISIRDASSGGGTLPTSQNTSNRFSTIQSGTVHLEIESFRYPLKSAESSDSGGREKVIDIPGIGFPVAGQEVVN